MASATPSISRAADTSPKSASMHRRATFSKTSKEGRSSRLVALQLGNEMTRGAEHYPSSAQPYASKVPEVTLGFWIIKILATTLGETGGDTVTMTWDLGYLTGTAIFLSALLVLVVIQIAARSFTPSFTGPRSLPRRPPDNDGRLCNPLFGCRVHRRLIDPVCLSHGSARPVVLVARLHIGRDRQHAKG